MMPKQIRKFDSMSKITTGYKVKGAAMAVKDVEPKTRRVTVMLSKFDTIDSDNDIIRMGAFSKSIMERGPESSSNRS